MPQVPLNIVNNEIDILGELVTITVKSGKTYSDWGDEASTETDTIKVKAIYNVYNRKSTSYDEGSFQSAELTFFFKSNQSGIVNGTKVTRSNGEVFSIDDTRSHGVEGNIHFIEALVEKV
jgi:hypothetical protein